MNLVVFSDDTLYDDGEHYVSKNPLTRLYAALASKLGTVAVSGPARRSTNPVEGYRHPAITYRPRPHYDSVIGFFKRAPTIIRPTYRTLRAQVKAADLIMLRLPSPVGPLVAHLARKHDTPFFVYLVADIKRAATHGEKYDGAATKAFVHAAASTFDRINKRIANGSLVFTAGSDLQERFRSSGARCVNFVPSVVDETDIHLRSDACEDETLELLFVGRLVPVKGIKYLLEAVCSLAEGGLDVSLRVVGDGPQRDALERLTARLGIEQRVTFCGHVAFGPELLEYYRRSDVFVLPSLSEGVPKTLTEAMASGLPVVATDVGGVSDVVADGTGLLVNSRSANDIHDAVVELHETPSLRREIIETGYEFARTHTVDAQAERMCEEIRAFYAGTPHTGTGARLG